MPVILLGNLKPRALCHQDSDSAMCLPKLIHRRTKLLSRHFLKRGPFASWREPGETFQPSRRVALRAGTGLGGGGSLLFRQPLAFHPCLFDDRRHTRRSDMKLVQNPKAHTFLGMSSLLSYSSADRSDA